MPDYGHICGLFLSSVEKKLSSTESYEVDFVWKICWNVEDLLQKAPYSFLLTIIEQWLYV